MALDAFASVMALIGGLVIFVTKSTFVDPLISVLIGSLLLYNSWEIIKEVFGVLLETSPSHIKIDDVRRSILEFDGIKNIDDLHIWSLSTDYVILTSVVIIDDQSLQITTETIDNLRQFLFETYAIDHATIEVRLESRPHLD